MFLMILFTLSIFGVAIGVAGLVLITSEQNKRKRNLFANEQNKRIGKRCFYYQYEDEHQFSRAWGDDID